MNMADTSYLGVARRILQEGEWKNNRTGIRTKVIPFQHFQHNMATGFPLLTTKKMGLKNIAAELEFFIKGLTDKRWLEERRCLIWAEWSNPLQKPHGLSKEEESKWQRENPDLGPLGYSHNWRNFNGTYKPIPYIYTKFDKEIKIITTNKSKHVGKIYENKYGKYTVIEAIRQNKQIRYIIQFNQTGYKNNVSSTNLINNQVKDLYAPAIFGVACLGKYDKTNEHHYHLHRTWYNIISRCYCETDKDYENYGKLGCYVSNDWLIYENFLNDVKNIPGWQDKLNNWKGFSLDKDYGLGNCYSKENCRWISHSQQSRMTKSTYKFKAIDPNGKEYIYTSLTDCAKEHNLDSGSISRVISGKYSNHLNWKFEKISNCKDNINADQLKVIVDKLKSNPDDRRMICSGWNPLQINEMALPPCHYSWNVVHINGKLNLHVNIRSQDVFLGMPYNIASYALLLLLLCKESGLIPGMLSILSADCHIYENHLPQVEEQIGREPYEAPQVEILDRDGKFSIFDWQYTDFKLNNYNSHPAIKGEVAV